MPNYLFQRVGSEETKEFTFSMKEVPSFGTVIKRDGIKWKRLMLNPQVACAGLKAIDPYSPQAFVNKTGQMKGTLGDLWDASKELSERRAQKEGGTDPLRKKYYADYKRRKRGTPHSQELAEGHKAAKEHLNKGLKELGVSIVQPGLLK